MTGLAVFVAAAVGLGEAAVALAVGTALGLAEGVAVAGEGVAAGRGVDLARCGLDPGRCAQTGATPITRMESASNELRVRVDLGRSRNGWPIVSLFL